jgi:hypothetical protein
LAKIFQLEPKRPAPAGSPLTPELKEFIDRVIVPILVKQYLAEEGGVPELAERVGGVAKSTASTLHTPGR